MTTLPNIHPGEVLREEFLVPLNLSAYRVAKDTKIPLNRVTAIVKGKRAITVDTALRLGRFFGTTPEFWINLQTAYDIEEREREVAPQLAAIRQYAAE